MVLRFRYYSVYSTAICAVELCILVASRTSSFGTVRGALRPERFQGDDASHARHDRLYRFLSEESADRWKRYCNDSDTRFNQAPV